MILVSANAVLLSKVLIITCFWNLFTWLLSVMSQLFTAFSLVSYVRKSALFFSLWDDIYDCRVLSLFDTSTNSATLSYIYPCGLQCTLHNYVGDYLYYRCDITWICNLMKVITQPYVSTNCLLAQISSKKCADKSPKMRQFGIQKW